MCTLTISGLTNSNLPWFMDLTFQVPTQYCSLQHWILLSSPNTSITEHHFRFSAAASFFLGLLAVVLHSSQSHTGHLPTWGLIFQYQIFLSFYTFHGVLMASILGWFAIPLFSQNSPLWSVCLGWPYTAWLTAALSYARPFTTERYPESDLLECEVKWALESTAVSKASGTSLVVQRLRTCLPV